MESKKLLQELISARKLNERDAEIYKMAYEDIYNCPSSQIVTKCLMIYLELSLGRKERFKTFMEAVNKILNCWTSEFDTKVEMFVHNDAIKNKE